MSARSKRLVIDAFNVHVGGGYILLKELLRALERQDRDAIVFLDARLESRKLDQKGLNLHFVNANILGRIKHYISFRKFHLDGDVVLCFGNIPPLVKPRNCVTHLFLQNWLLICPISELRASNPRTFFRLLSERIALRLLWRNVDRIIVQTDTMKRELQNRFPAASVCVSPFMAESSLDVAGVSKALIYPATGGAHKNHRNLVHAWIYLSERGLFPALTLTIDERVFPELTGWIDDVVEQYSLNIQNIGFVDDSIIQDYYSAGATVIFPSYFESFGIPLVQANALGLKILASERDFVRDVCLPTETFDPDSYVSIARAVMRHLDVSSKPVCETADDIVNKLI